MTKRRMNACCTGDAGYQFALRDVYHCEVPPLLPHCATPVTSFVALVSDPSAGYHSDLIPVSQWFH